MLIGLSTGEQSAQYCFVLLQQQAYSSNISWNHIFHAFERYYDSLRVDFAQKAVAAGTPSLMRNIKTITQQELQALITVTKLVNHIAYYSEKSRIALCEFQNFNETSLNTTTNMLSSYHTPINSLPLLMFGLLTCSIPVNLKGEILKLLSSLALTPQIALNLWQALENSQIVPTIQAYGVPGVPKSGIEAELDEIEAREESYSMLIGFLHLIKNLIKIPIPDNLGAGFRSKGIPLGFQPYLQFLVNHVYLKVFQRSYKNPNDKWQIITLLLNIFYKIIQKYEINEADFKMTSSSASAATSTGSFDLRAQQQTQSSGYRLLYEFLNDGPITQTLFRILNESLQHVFMYNMENNLCIENSGLYSLRLINIILNKQKLFIDYLKNFNMYTATMGMDKLLIAISSKTNKCDNLLCIYRFIQQSAQLTMHAYYSINILLELTDYLDINQQMLHLFLISFPSLKEQYDIIHGVLESIEFDECDIVDDDLLEDNDENNIDLDNLACNKAKYKALTRVKMLKFISFNLKLQSPNLSHLLLGFDVKKPLQKQAFYLPGTNLNIDQESLMHYQATGGNASATAGHPINPATQALLSIVSRNCMHSIIHVINLLLNDNYLLYKQPLTIDLCYEILYQLCSNLLYSNQILYFLRNEYDLIYNHWKQAPFDLIRIDNTKEEYAQNDANMSSSVSVSSLIDSENTYNQDDRQQQQQRDQQNQREQNKNELLNAKHVNRYIYAVNAWILQLTAIEMQNLFINRMRKQALKLVQLLTETSADSEQTMINDFSIKQSINISKRFNILPNESTLKQQQEFPNRLFKLISIIELAEQAPDMLSLNYFDVNLTEKVINSCKYKTDLVGMTSGGVAGVGAGGATIQLYNVKQIQSILMNELAIDSNIASSKLNIIREIKYILNNIVERNQFQLRYASKKRYLDSFKVFIECFVLFTTSDIYNINFKYQFLINFIKELLNLVFANDVIIELTYSIGSLLFSLMCNLRLIVSESLKQQLNTPITSIIGNNLDNSNLVPLQHHRIFMNPSQFYEILNKLVSYLINSCKFSV